MARVCVDWFPETKGFTMDDRLKIQLDVLLKNIRNDWDFTIIISGQGEVRVGKSMLAMQIGAYWAYELEKRYVIKVPFDIENNFVFDGKELIKKGNYLGQNFKFSPLVFDEAGSDLEGRKVMQNSTKDVIDFFRECGQYNMLNILVLPEFFDLPKGIALSRSIFLLDVYYIADEEGLFKRGYYHFYSRRSKKLLYLFGKQRLDYHCVRSDFGKLAGRFYKFYPIDEIKYKELKQKALVKRESKKRDKQLLQRDASWFILNDGIKCKHCGEIASMTLAEIGTRMEALTGNFVPHQTLSDALRHFRLENEDNLGE